MVTVNEKYPGCQGAFEAFAREVGWCLTPRPSRFNKNGFAGYMYPRVESHWLVWKTSWRTAVAACRQNPSHDPHAGYTISLPGSNGATVTFKDVVL